MVNHTSPAIRELAESIWELNRRVDGLESPQLSHSSLDNFYLNIYDDEGNKTGEIGRLPDGSTGVNTIDGPTPVAPSEITARTGNGYLAITWMGSFAGGSPAPMDFKQVEIHASPTPNFIPTADNTIATMTATQPTTRLVTLAAGTYYLTATTLSIPGKRSLPTPEVEGISNRLADEPSITEALDDARKERERAAEEAAQELAVLDGKLGTARTDLDTARSDLETLETVTLPGAVADLEQADADAQQALTELDGKLAGLGDSELIGDLRTAIADAQQAVTAAQTTASEAVTAANAASQAALEAAGIADKKGRVIVQETEPQGEDRKSSNIWIQPVPDDPDTEVQEKAVTYVYLAETDEWQPTTSSELAQAAQNALDAREAAQQAQQRADTAVANAAAAQAAAEAAQQTADAATLSARDAHNEAVAAQGDATEALEKYGPLDQRTIDAQAAADAAQARADEAYAEAAKKLDESQVDAKVLASANGKNSITRSTSAASASTPGVVEGDLWVQVDSAGDAFAQWYWDGNSWEPSLIKNEMMESLDVHKLQVTGSAAIEEAVIDKLFTQTFATHQLTAEQVVVSSGANLFVDAGGRASMWNASSYTTYPDGGRNGGWSLVIPSGDTSLRGYYGGLGDIPTYGTPVEPGQQYRISCWVRGSVTGGSYAARIYVRSYDSAGGNYAFADPQYFSSGPLVANEWTHMEQVVTVPDTGTRLVIGCYSYGYEGAIRFSDISVQQMAGAVLIEDGAVTAPKITITGDPDNPDEVGLAANLANIIELEASHLKVTETAEIDEAVVDKLWADGIAAKAATFNKVTVATSNLVPDLAAAVEAGDTSYWSDFGINLGDPSFWVAGDSSASRFIDYEFPLDSDTKYSFEVQVRATTPGSKFYVRLIDEETGSRINLVDPTGDSSTGDPFPGMLTTDTGSFTHTYRGTGFPAVSTLRARIQIYPNHPTGADNSGGYMWFKGLKIRPMVGAVLIEDGAINADKIDADSVGAELITANTLRTNTSGERLELNSQGVVLYGPDAEEGERVRLGPSGENLLTIGSSTISADNVASVNGSYDNLTVGGQDLTDIIDSLPRGMRAWGALEDSSKYDSDTSQYARRAELQTTLLPNRLYRVQLSAHYVDVEGSVDATVVEELRYSLDKDYITTGSSPDSGRKEYSGAKFRQHVQSGSARAVPGLEFFYDTEGWTEERHFWVMYMVLPEQSDRPVRVLARHDYPTTLSIEDMGPSQPGLLKRWNDGSGLGAQDPAPTIKRYTDTWGAGGWGGDISSGDIVQGYYSGVGNRSGSWKFSSAMQSALRGSTIEKFEVYLYANHWWYGAGGTASIRPTTGGYKSWTGSAFTSANWPRNAGRWVTVPSSWYPYIASGTYGGIGVQTSSNSSTYYGRFSGTATKFRATYRK